MSRLRVAGGPLTAGQLAEALDVHHTVVREHLGLLIEAGMVRSEPLPVIGRGRPRTGYLSVAEAEPDVAYRTLAGLLAEMVATGADAREVGRRSASTVQPSTEGAVATMRREAERLGFNPHVRSKGDVHEIVLRDCPFAAVAAERPDTVCELHLGLAEGICDLVGGAVVDCLRLADPRKGGCRLVMRSLQAP